MIYPAGTEVQYTNAFLHSIGEVPTGNMCSYRGEVVDDPERLGGLDPERFVVVKWSHDPDPVLINVVNVAPLRTAKLLDVPLWATIPRTKKRRKRK